ncbi:MAG TPA: MaoC/PaaZ C-terminal domain-containing protein [Candidatus Dormibacteraeota bacterium]|jgi:acyl dehydratase|nr:MaoC/PaaZ C-terminal domain-containing protein [Candidatus Dormibacteraeota bacterium]
MSSAVGDQLDPLSVVINREMIAAYAVASGDTNPIHLDEDFARSVGLPGVIAHGMLQMGLLASYLSQWSGSGGRLGRLRCRFSGMVEAGDSLTFGGRVLAVSDDQVSLEVWALNQKGEKVLSKGEASIRI